MLYDEVDDDDAAGNGALSDAKCEVVVDAAGEPDAEESDAGSPSGQTGDSQLDLNRNEID